MSVNPAFDELMRLRQGKPPGERIELRGTDPVLPTPFALGETNSAILLAVGVAVNDLWELKTGDRQNLSIGVREAAAALKSYEYFTDPEPDGAEAWALQRSRQQISTPHPTKDGRYFLPHMGLPHLAERILKILDCDYELDSVKRAVACWDAMELEDEVARANGCGAMVRSTQEWQASEQGQALSDKPVVEIIKIAESEPMPLPAGDRPLSGINVLDLTRILAGPTCARTLAEHGANVLMVTAQHLPQAERFVKDTSHGKRSCFLDLRQAEQREQILSLVSSADVFSQGYRPGVMQRLGLSPEELARHRPGLIYTSMNCYGFEGPFSDRAGWEQLAQTVTGIADEQGIESPQLLPAAACDYTTGYLAAYGTLLALGLRARFGGSYHVRASLCQSAMFLQRQRRTTQPELQRTNLEISAQSLGDKIRSTQSDYGEISFLGPVLEMSATPPNWTRSSPKLGRDPATWQ